MREKTVRLGSMPLLTGSAERYCTEIRVSPLCVMLTREEAS